MLIRHAKFVIGCYYTRTKSDQEGKEQLNDHEREINNRPRIRSHLPTTRAGIHLPSKPRERTCGELLDVRRHHGRLLLWRVPPVPVPAAGAGSVSRRGRSGAAITYAGACTAAGLGVEMLVVGRLEAREAAHLRRAEELTIKGGRLPHARRSKAQHFGLLRRRVAGDGGGRDRIFRRGDRGRWGKARKGAFFIGFLEGKRTSESRRKTKAAVVACLFLESIAATTAAARTNTRLCLLSHCYKYAPGACEIRIWFHHDDFKLVLTLDF
jgi:hypothetical protein